MAWEEVKLKELISEMGDGGTPTTTEPSNFGGNIPWAVVDDVVSKIRSTKESLTEKGFKACSAKKWPIGSIILTTGATIGQVGISEIELCTKQGITGIVVNNYANAEFLKFWFELNTKQLLRFAQGTTFKEIRPRTLGNLRIQIPYPFTSSGLAEQTAIATILSKVDEAIAAIQNSIKAAEKLKKALMQNLLTGKLKPDGSWRTEDEFYEDEKFGKVPKGWEVKKLKDVFFVNQNSLASQTEGNFTFRYITIEAVQTESIDFESCPEFSFKDSPGRARRIINDNDILISGVRPNLKAFAIYQKPNDENWICSTGFYVLTAKDEENHKYHFYQILSEIGERQFHSYVAGSNYPAIGDRDLKLLKLLRPPYDEQCLIEEKISSISVENSKKQTKIQTLQRLKKSLMQNLLTGKVRLPQEFIAQFENEVAEPSPIETRN